MVERPHEYVTEKPPKWWHDAIRNNIAGNLINDDRFVSFPYQIEGDFLCTLISQTKDDPKGFAEGIYVDTTIPAKYAKSLEPMIMNILAPITDVIKKEGVTRDDIIPHPDPRLAELGMKLNVSHSFNVGVNISNGFVVLAIEPSKAEEAKGLDAQMGFENLVDRIVDQYFSNMDVIDRTKILMDTATPDPLRKLILKKEFTNIDLAVKTMLSEKVIEQKRLDEINSDKLMQEMYARFVEKIGQFQTPMEKSVLQNTLWLMDYATLAGFFTYYKNYWQEKLGPIS